MNLKAVIEGLLFVVGDDGLSLEEFCNITEKSKEEITETIKSLFEDYNNENRGIQLEFLGNKFKLTTKSEHKSFYQKLVKEDENSVLSQSSLETLAIIAYNGPITRIDIDEIRGVNSSYIIRKLLLKGLIEDVGYSNSAGKPKLYNTTSRFLDYFGLGTKEDLPKIDTNNIEEKEEEEEKDLFNSKYSE